GAPAAWSFHLGVLLSNRLSFVDTTIEPNGRIIFATVQIGTTTFRLANIYAPADRHTCGPFFDDLASDALHIGSLDLLLGDWNAYPDPSTDRISPSPYSPLHQTWHRLRPALAQHLDAAQLGHPGRYYTYNSRSSPMRSRIDHVFLSNQYADHSFTTTLHHYPFSDHIIVQVTISPP